MADLSAVLRKTIDALPAATPQLRAKVYDKARAAVQRQIASANPPLSAELVDARQRALESAIAATEAHYAGTAAPEPNLGADAPPAQVPATSTDVAPPPAPEPLRCYPTERSTSAALPSGDASRAPAPTSPPAPLPVAPRPPFDAPDLTRPAEPERVPEKSWIQPPERPVERLQAPFAPTLPTPDRSQPARAVEVSPDDDARVGEIGPMSELPQSAPSEADRAGSVIPAADLTAPNYARPRRASGSRGSALTGVLALLFVGGLGAAGYFYRDEISAALTGEQTAAVDGAAQPTATGEAAAPQTPAEPAAGQAEAPPANDPSSRRFTQRLLPDGTEVDEGPAEGTANAFDEGTDIATASVTAADGAGEPAAAAPSPATPPAPTAPAATETGGEVPVAQRAVFYEERSADRPGSQLTGNVVWSTVNEPPATGQPAEPAIRAIADIAETNLRMTMTIRRNADETLPASHVIEILFDTPADFAGGEIENVQRLALKPTEQERGEPLIGVAGKISDGFFIIALNDLEQAVENNLALMANQQWIDIPMAYASGQRALMSLEKGIPGERVFQEVIEAWAQTPG